MENDDFENKCLTEIEKSKSKLVIPLNFINMFIIGSITSFNTDDEKASCSQSSTQEKSAIQILKSQPGEADRERPVSDTPASGPAPTETRSNSRVQFAYIEYSNCSELHGHMQVWKNGARPISSKSENK